MENLNKILPFDLDTVESLFIYRNPRMTIPVMPFILTGSDGIGGLSAEGAETVHVRCQFRGTKLIGRTKEGFSNATDFNIKVQFIDPAYQTVRDKFMSIAADIVNNSVVYLNIKTLMVYNIDMVNFVNRGALDAEAFIQPTVLTGNGNLSAQLDLSIVTGLIALISGLLNSGVSPTAVALYKEFLQRFEEKAILSGKYII